MTANVEEEEGDASQVGHPSAPEGSVKAPMLGEDTTYKHTEANAYIPRYQESRSSSAPLLISSEIDKHILERGEHVPIA